MSYRSLRECIEDLDKNGMLLRIRNEVDPNLEMAEIQRRAYSEKAPAVFFEKVKGSPFPAVSNLFGTEERSRFIFRKTWSRTQAAIRIKADPVAAMKEFWKYWHAPFTGMMSLPMKTSHIPVMECETTIDKLPQIKSWPDDGGPFITLPQVFSEDPVRTGIMRSNIGMYRVQLCGGEYIQNQEIGLHYQIHRGIGVHHSAAIKVQKPLLVAIFVGGPPAHTVAAVMPLPEGLSEVVFAGMLAGRRFRYSNYKVAGFGTWRIAADADFCIIGTIANHEVKPEGPFGDHLGYYSLKHPFPVMKVHKVFHRRDAIWLFTVVGRPPQEDTSFGAMIHDLTKPMVPVSLPGVKAMHAVDAAGVHPLLFAIGSERYAPYAAYSEQPLSEGQSTSAKKPVKPRPQELLTQANAILGFNQASLAKYLFIADQADDPTLDINDEAAFLRHILLRADWRRDLHFQTKTTIDTLDYSGSGLNEGSKVVLAVRGNPIRELALAAPSDLKLPSGFSHPKISIPGVLLLRGPRFSSYDQAELEFKPWSDGEFEFPDNIALVVIVDDEVFTGKTLINWLWVTFTRSQPSHDIYGVKSSSVHKHWACEGSLIIDGRIKPHHAPPLVENESISKQVDAMWNALK